MVPDRYDASGLTEAQFEPGSDGTVLRNKLGIIDAREMDDVELALLIQLYDTLPEEVEQDQTLTTVDLRRWHYRWLGNVYEWAGRYRKVNLGKAGFQSAAAGQIARLMEQLDREFLSRLTPCMGMDDEQLVEAIAIVHVELILIHPFREGNGRLARLLANVMAMQANKPELDFTSWDARKADYYAAIQAGLDDYAPMKTLVRRVICGV